MTSRSGSCDVKYPIVNSRMRVELGSILFVPGDLFEEIMELLIKLTVTAPLHNWMFLSPG